MGKRAKADKEDVAPPQPLVIEADQYKRTYFGPEEPTLQLECWEEELNEAQIQAHKIADEEYKSIQTKLDDIVQETKGEIVYNGHQFTAYQLLGKQPILKDLENKSADIIRSRSRSISKEPKEIKRKGRPPKNKKERVPSPSPEPEPPSPEPERSLRKKHKKEQKKEKEKEKEKDSSKVKDKTLAPSNVNSVVTNVRPSEATAIGGLATGGGKNTPIVDLTKEDANKDTADSKEVSFNKLQGKTFPSLVVVARPYLRIKEATPSDRSVLDNKVKSVLMHTPTKFTEWLIQQGLVRSEQACAVHIGNKLKLGMYSDVSKFPYSGGYVWISECCPTRFISVFSGSIFEGATHPPSVLLKLVYHWACQTNVQNVVQWVKVDNLYVKGLFTWLRATCTAALHQHLGLMGGAGRKIEVGVISLGTTSHDGTQRQVKVEVLGVLDPVEKTIRLRAVEPLGELEKNYKKRFQKILEPLGNWVHPGSTILTDLTVDKGTLINMGFKTVHQASSSSDPPAKHSNANIMEYLRRIVPRMFQNTLSLLSRQIIQQFLDELVWREKHGITPGQAFDNIVSHIAEQTRFDGKDKLTTRLTKIAANPFKNWKTSGKKKKESELAEVPPPVEDTGRGKRGRKAKKTFSPPPSPPPRKSRKTYVEEDDDDEEIPLAVRKKRIKQEKETKEKEEPKKKTRESRESARESRESTRESRKRDRSYVVDDLDDVPLKAIKKEMKQEEMVVMERFYFGQYGGNDEMPRATIAVKCTTCSKEFNNNCELMRHVFTHIVPPPGASDGETIAQCNYCLCQFATTNDLTIHMKHSHPNDTKIADLFTYACLICEVRFASLTALANHMQKSHAPLELPYRCGRCDFRVSSHRAVVDHFYTAHKEDTCVQCPYCLKIVTVYADGCDLQSNVEHFIEHLSQHQDKELSAKCNRCVLSFVHIGMMKEHQVRSHTSVDEATPLCHEEHQISKPRGKPRPPVKDTANHTMLDTYERLLLHVPDGYLCKECDLHLEHDKHFLGTCRCSKCPFTSSCWRGVLQHSALCAGPNLLESAPRDAPYATHCVCGFSTTVATAMLTHLLACERKSAYPSEEEAKANIKRDEPEHSRDTTSTSKEIEEAPKEAEEPQKDSNLSLHESDTQQTTADQGMSDYAAPPSVLNAQLSLDDLGPPSVIGQNEQNEPELLKHDAYEQPLATPLVRHEQLEQSQYGTLPDFEPLPTEPPPHTEFEPL